jgi:alcohol dehydrogenase (cytochrome c)
MIVFALLLFLSPQEAPPPQLFTNRCAGCHGEAARGTAKAPGLAMNPRVAEQSAEQLGTYIGHGNPGAGMPAFAGLPASDLMSLAHYLRHINNDMIVLPPPPKHLIRKTIWSAPQPGDWLTYNGNDSANRYSPLDQITTANVSSLKLKWVFPIAHFGLEVTPLAADGVLYVTGPNQVFALDALNGNPLWHYSRPPTASVISDASLGTNRGVAILRDKVFFVTDNAHLLALDRGSGSLLWEIAMAPATPGEHHSYGGTMAPLVVDNLVIAGVSGADEGIRGFVAAFQADTGALAWRRWTVPRRGEQGIETWKSKEPVTGGAVTRSFSSATTWLPTFSSPSCDSL